MALSHQACQGDENIQTSPDYTPQSPPGDIPCEVDYHNVPNGSNHSDDKALIPF